MHPKMLVLIILIIIIIIINRPAYYALRGYSVLWFLVVRTFWTPNRRFALKWIPNFIPSFNIENNHELRYPNVRT